MVKNTTSCIKCGDSEKSMVKNGKSQVGKQRYICKSCGKTRVESYTYNAYIPNINSQIITLTKEGMGIRSTARVLHISPTTLLRRIVAISQSIRQPPVPKNKSYEVDEIRTFLKSKSQQIWIVYALEKATRRIVSFAVGSRSNRTLNIVLDTLHLAQAQSIFTDGLKTTDTLLQKPFIG